jgi:hypothetical protein
MSELGKEEFRKYIVLHPGEEKSLREKHFWEVLRVEVEE